MPETITSVTTVPAETMYRLQRRLRGWSARTRGVGAAAFLEALFDVAGPLALLGAQGVWMAQPLLSLLLPADEIGGLARLLETSEGVAWLRDQLHVDDPGEAMTGSADDIKAGD